MHAVNEILETMHINIRDITTYYIIYRFKTQHFQLYIKKLYELL